MLRIIAIVVGVVRRAGAQLVAWVALRRPAAAPPEPVAPAPVAPDPAAGLSVTARSGVWQVRRDPPVVAPVDTDGDVVTLPAPAPVVDTVEPPAPAQRPRRRRPSTPTAAAQLSTIWRFRDDVLDRLDEYFACLRRLKKAAPDDYALFSRVGLTVPWCYVNPAHPAAIDPTTDRPSFGGVLLSTHDRVADPSKVFPSFVYFQKFAHPIGVQRTKAGDVYALTAVFDSRGSGRRQLVAPAVCHVAIDDDGAIRLLRERTVEQHDVQPGARRRGGHRPDKVRLSRETWRAPGWVASVASEHQLTPTQYVAWVFRLAFATAHEATGRILIRATRGGDAATFGIELSTARTFFADRDADALAADGRRKRIFHYVAAHSRTLATGRVTTVGEHYRGSRRFTWNGADVVIVLPDRARLHFDAPAYEVGDGSDATGLIPVADGADMLVRVQTE